MKAYRIISIFIRHIYLYKRSLPRLMEVFYWPFVDLLLWGFITIYLAKYRENLPTFVSFLVGALILWDILFRSQAGISISFLEEMWSRNLLNLFVSPLRPTEYIFSLMLVSLAKITIAATAMSLLAWLIYSFNIFLLGISLLPFIILLTIMGWAIGIITTAVILRFGQEAEVLAWGIAFLFLPVSAVFYPVSVLPTFLRSIARYIPASHIFEGMRAVISTGVFPAKELLWASGLNLLYIIAAFSLFYWVFRVIRKKGLLAKIGD